MFSAVEAARHIPDYSQDHEQGHILKCVSSITKGRFLDIGAFHPTNLSNTRALYELGWSGVMVEPSPAPMLTLMKEYGFDTRVALLSSVVVPTNEGGLYPMAITDGPYSTSDVANFKKWNGHAEFYAHLLVPVMPLAALLQLGPFDFIDIDVEGGSKDLFIAMLDLDMKLPKCVCVEYDDHRAEIEARAKASNYQHVYTNATNIIFARSNE